MKPPVRDQSDTDDRADCSSLNVGVPFFIIVHANELCNKKAKVRITGRTKHAQTTCKSTGVRKAETH